MKVVLFFCVPMGSLLFLMQMTLCCCCSVTIISSDILLPPPVDVGVPQQKGFLGGDIAASVVMNNVSVWVFGDTLQGHLQDDRRVITSMPRNSVALVTQKNNKVIRSSQSQEPNDTGGFFTSLHPGQQWLWPTALSYHSSMDELSFFCSVVETNTNHSHGAFGFNIVSSNRISVKHPSSSDLSSWVLSQHILPFKRFSFSVASFVSLPYTYVYGRPLSPRDPNVNSAFLSRTTDFVHWTILQTNGSWVEVNHQSEQNAAQVMKNAPSEMTVTKLSDQCFVSLMVPMLGDTKVVMRTSPQLWGPWSNDDDDDGNVVLKIPMPYNDTKKFFCYACKVHEEMSELGDEEGTLIWTFMSNAYNVTDLNDNVNIYQPVFVRTKYSIAKKTMKMSVY